VRKRPAEVTFFVLLFSLSQNPYLILKTNKEYTQKKKKEANTQVAIVATGSHDIKIIKKEK
jgi:hypothetical protein